MKKTGNNVIGKLMRKKLLSITIAAALISVIFTGCGKKEEAEQKVSISPEEAIENAKEEMANAENLLNEKRKSDGQEKVSSSEDEEKSAINAEQSSNKILNDTNKVSVVEGGYASGYGVYIGADDEALMQKLSNDTEIGLAIIDAQYISPENISALKSRGKMIYSYINAGSLENFRDYYDTFKEKTLGAYENWDGEYWMDTSDEEWQNFLCNDLAPSLMEKGIDGFFVDNADVYFNYPREDIYEGLKNIVSNLSKMTGGRVIINGGDAFVLRLIEDNNLGVIEGINQECVCSKVDDYSGNIFAPQDEETKNYYLAYLDEVSKNGGDVYLIEYTEDEAIIDELKKLCDEKGYKCYVTNSLGLAG